MADIVLRQADIDRFTGVLSKLVGKARLGLSVLIHKDGHLLASHGTTELLDTTALAALVSANFSSTIAVANLIGEKEFRTQFHKGTNRSIFISLIDEDTFLASIFDNGTDIDTVKVYTDEYSRELAEALQALYNGGEEPPQPLDLDTSAFPLDETIVMPRSELAAQMTQEPPKSQRPQKKPEQQAQARPRPLPHTRSPEARQHETDVFYIDLLAGKNPYEEKGAKQQRAAAQPQRTPAPAENDTVEGEDSGKVNPKYLKKKAQEMKAHKERKTRTSFPARKKRKS